MTKLQLIEQIAKEAGVTNSAGKQTLKSLLDTISNELVNADGKVRLSGFGTFSTTQRQVRKARNLRTAETIEIKVSDTVKFKPTKTLEDSF